MSVADVLGLVGSTVEGVRLDACVGASGVSLLYRGQHLAAGEPVAVKVLRLSHLGGDAAAREAVVGRFRDETKILQHLAHGNRDIVRCVGMGEAVAPATGERIHYMVLEWLEGRSLAADLEERRQRGLRGRSLVEALDLLESAALAVAHAHSQGIVHRGLTPTKLFLARTRGGLRLRVLGFGVAKILTPDVDHPRLGFEQSVKTMSGAHLCSPSYAAPEQFNPRLGAIGTWTDVYSLTLILLEVMLGEPVRMAQTSAEGAVKALDPATGSPRPTRLGLRLPSLIDDLLTRAVAQSPHERPANGSVLWSALRELGRLNAQPVHDAAALAPTAMAGDVADAILKMRAATAGMAPGAPQPASPEAPTGYHGTMLMVNAPGGLQLLNPGNDPTAVTAPMPIPPLPTNAQPPHGGLPSPLASSLGPGVQSPLPRAVPAPVSPATASDAFRPVTPVGMTTPVGMARPGQSSAPSVTGSGPSVPPVVKPRGPALLVAALAVLVVAVAAVAAFVLLRSRL